jgi:hypothetical protein
MAATTTSVRPERSPRVRLAWVVPVAVALAAVVLLVTLSTSLPARESITVRNDTAEPVTVRARGADGGWAGIGTVEPRSTLRFDEVIDQGAVWRFRLTVGPDPVGEQRLGGKELAAAGWRITVPAGAAAEVEDARRG